MWILGINAAYHEPAACLFLDGELVAAVEEERFNRIRHGKPADLLNPHHLPEQSIGYCLQFAGISAADLGRVGFSFHPKRRLEHNVGLNEATTPDGAGTPEGEKRFNNLLKQVPEELTRILGVDVEDRFQWIEHHLCHAASAFYASPWKEAAVLSVDGIGEATSTWLGVGRGGKLETVKEIKYPHSIGLLWTKMSRFLGFGEYGQWKVMGLAGFGDSERFHQAFQHLIAVDESGDIRIDIEKLQVRAEHFKGLEGLLGERRGPGGELDQRHCDIAAGLQRTTEEALLSLASYLHRTTGMKFLCQAGGVALNCVANRTILEHGPFHSTFVQPAANDAGTALGACYYIWHHELSGQRSQPLTDVSWGPAWSSSEAAEFLEPGTAKVTQPSDLADVVAALIADGEVVAWFQGRMEFGPRALGRRSFLADPRRSEIVHTLNERIKHREFFRPFAASVLEEEADNWFELQKQSPSDAFMLYARRLRQSKKGKIPAVTHIDDTCRLQLVSRQSHPAFHRLIQAFNGLTGVPIVLNTSLNDSEPIVCSPQDVIATCQRVDISYLVLEDQLVEFAKTSTSPER